MAGIVITGTDTDGIVLSNPVTDDPATVNATGSVTNNTATHNYDAIYGAPGYAWSITNLGTIAGGTPIGADDGSRRPDVGVHLMAGGVVTNGQSGSSAGSIRGSVAGVGIEGGSGSVTNFGTIESSGYDFTAGVSLWAGGSVTNGESGSAGGLIVGGMGVYIEGGSGTVVNFGTIAGVSGGEIMSGYANGVSLFQGSVTNNEGGLITGYDAAVLISHGSVENFGTIEGSIGVDFYGALPSTMENGGTIRGDGGTAVQFGGADDRLIVDPGAVFVGTVDGAGGSDVLELAAGTGNKTLSGLGTNFVNFETVVFDTNAGWTATFDNAFTGTISGFAAGDILDLIGKAATGVTYAGGVLTVQNGGTVVAAFNLAGSYNTADFSVGSDGHGGTVIGIAAALPSDTPTAINGSVTTAENHAVSGSVTSTGDTDGDVIYVVDVGPAHGTLTSFNGATGGFIYTPATNYFGSDSFQFHAVDGSFSSNQATESIAVNGDTPTAINGLVTTTENHTVSGSVTSTGDSDNDVIYIIDVAPAHGTLTSFNGATGSFTYTPATKYFGPDGFKFHAVDGPVSSNQATETITVDALPPTSISVVADSAHLAAIQVEGSSSGLHGSTAIGMFTETGGISGDAYTFTLGGASGFSMNSASGNGTLSTTGSTVSGVTNGRVYLLTVTANDTTNSTHSAVLPFDVVVGSGQNSSSGNDTIKLAAGSGNLGIGATTPTIVYGLNGKDTIDATGMTANVWFVGGPGPDTMTGGGGVDTYLYAAAGESKSGTGNFDTINGFVQGTDKIDFRALFLTANTGVANTNPGSFTSGNTTGLFSSQVAGTGIVVQHAGGAEQVYVDVNHDGNFNTGSDMMIHLNGITAPLANTDFIV
jgi:hypothetical protein